MHVSAVEANNYSVLGNFLSNETYNRPFTSFEKYRADDIYDDINEWKDFCQSQILAGNIDFMA